MQYRLIAQKCNKIVVELYVQLTSFLGPVDQPCLRLTVHPQNNFSSEHQLLGIQRSPVCTFCLANQKKVVSL
jgi:hypothetical protein